MVCVWVVCIGFWVWFLVLIWVGCVVCCVVRRCLCWSGRFVDCRRSCYRLMGFYISFVERFLYFSIVILGFGGFWSIVIICVFW